MPIVLSYSSVAILASKLSSNFLTLNTNFSSNEDPIADAIEENAIIPGVTEQVPEKFTIPDHLPDVPIVAINRHPLFPGYVKQVNVSLY